MLSFSLSLMDVEKLKKLSHKISIEFARLQEIDPQTRLEMHRFAKVSQIGASTRIENAILTDAEINWMDTLLSEGRQKAFEEKQDVILNKFNKDQERSVEEVAGCRQMLSIIYNEGAHTFPLTEIFIRGLHHQLLLHYQKANYYAGQYKTVTNSVVETNSKTKKQKIVFKTADPGPITQTGMRDLIDWYNNTAKIEPWTVGVASELVFRFLAIHPFQDGNGRLGRGLFLYALFQSDDTPIRELAPYLAIDRQIEKNKQHYYFVLQQCSGGVYHQDPTQYNINLFVNFMTQMMFEALDDIQFYHQRVVKLQSLSEQQQGVFECLRDFPENKLKTNDIVLKTDIPRRTVIHALNSLVEKQLIQKYGRGSATRYQIVF